MLLKHLLALFELLDSPDACGRTAESYLRQIDPQADIQVYPLTGPKGSTDMIRIRIAGRCGKTAFTAGKTPSPSDGKPTKPAPTLGILGRWADWEPGPSRSVSSPTATALWQP